MCAKSSDNMESSETPKAVKMPFYFHSFATWPWSKHVHARPEGSKSISRVLPTNAIGR